MNIYVVIVDGTMNRREKIRLIEGEILELEAELHSLGGRVFAFSSTIMKGAQKFLDKILNPAIEDLKGNHIEYVEVEDFMKILKPSDSKREAAISKGLSYMGVGLKKPDRCYKFVVGGITIFVMFYYGNKSTYSILSETELKAKALGSSVEVHTAWESSNANDGEILLKKTELVALVTSRYIKAGSSRNLTEVQPSTAEVN